MDQGPTAVIRTDHGLTIMLTSRRMPPFSLRQLTTHGILPEQFHLLVAKGVNAPVAAYKEVCKHFIRVNTPGCHDRRHREAHLPAPPAADVSVGTGGGVEGRART